MNILDRLIVYLVDKKFEWSFLLRVRTRIYDQQIDNELSSMRCGDFRTIEEFQAFINKANALIDARDALGDWPKSTHVFYFPNILLLNEKSMSLMWDILNAYPEFQNCRSHTAYFGKIICANNLRTYRKHLSKRIATKTFNQLGT